MANLKLVLIIGVFLKTTELISASKRITSNEDLLRKLQAMKREVQCAGPSGRCFNTAHCCGGLICATFDEELGEKPELPGNCVKSKDLPGCSDRLGCPPGSDCVPLGRSGQRYCVHRERDQEEDEGESPPGSSQKGLGANCESSKDCNSMSLDGSLKLCCQKVRRGRQGVKQLCDRITPISVCLD